MKKSELFNEEIKLITSEGLQDFCRTFFDNYVPDYFFTVGASSTGKHHPKFAQGEGGLVRHTKAVVRIAEELTRLEKYNLCSVYHDFIIMACLFHDSCKYGKTEYDKFSFDWHEFTATLLVRQAWEDNFSTNVPEWLLHAIGSHMGQWSKAPMEFMTPLDEVVHLADYIASRSFIDIPDLSV